MANRKWFAAADDGDLDYILLHYGEMVGKQDSQFLDRTALMFAANRGHYEICEILALGKPSEVTIVNRRGNTALHFAASSGHVSIINMLAPLEARVRNENGDTALTHAILNGHVEAVRALIPFELDLPGSENKSPLELAKQIDNTELIHIIQSALSEPSPAIPVHAANPTHRHPAYPGILPAEDLIVKEPVIKDLSTTSPADNMTKGKSKSRSRNSEPSSIKHKIQSSASLRSAEKPIGISTTLPQNASLISQLTPINSADNSTAGSYADSSQGIRPIQLLEKTSAQQRSTGSFTVPSVLARSHGAPQDGYYLNMSSNYSFVVEEEPESHSLISRASILEKANKQLRAKNAAQVTKIMELEDRNATLTSLLETLMKPDSYAEDFRVDQASDEGAKDKDRCKETGKSSHKLATKKKLDEPISIEESRFIREEIKALRRENKALKDCLQEFAEKFDTFMLSTGMNFYTTE